MAPYQIYYDDDDDDDNDLGRVATSVLIWRMLLATSNCFCTTGTSTLPAGAITRSVQPRSVLSVFARSSTELFNRDAFI